MKFIITLFLICTSTLIQAQGNFEVSYNLGRFNSPNLNRTVYVYNYTRQWLDVKMDYFNATKGYTVYYGALYDNVGIGFGIGHNRQTNIAHGLEPVTGTIGYRKIMYTSTRLFADLPIRIINAKHLEINYVPSIEAVNNSLVTQYGHDAEFKNIEKNEATGKYLWGTTQSIAFRFFPVSWFGLSVKPFATLNLSKTDINELMGYLQSAAIRQTVEDKFNIYGISFSIVFANRDWY